MIFKSIFKFKKNLNYYNMDPNQRREYLFQRDYELEKQLDKQLKTPNQNQNESQSI